MRQRAAAPARPGGYREMLAVAVPLIISMGTFTVMQFCDRVFLARYSSAAIQAAVPAGVLSFTFLCIFQSLAGYAGTYVAQYHGAGDSRGCVAATVQGLWLSLLCWPLILALLPLGLWIMSVSGHAPEVLAQERVYFTWLMATGGLLPLDAAISGYFTGRSRMRLNTVAHVAGSLVNIALDYALIFGRWGFPEKGIEGAAIATVIASTVAPAIQLAVFLRERGGRRQEHGWSFALDWPLMGRMIRYGLPAGLQVFADVGAFTCFVLLTGRLGDLALAASNIGFSINGLAFSPLMGISFAASILVGQYQGRRASSHAATSGWTAVKIGWIYMAIVGLSYVLFPAAYYRLFGASDARYSIEELVSVGRPMLYMLAAWGLFDTVNIVLSGALKGAGDTRFVMLYMLLMGWLVWIPGEWLILSRGNSILAAWIWLALYILVLSFGFLWRWQRGRWKTIDLLERETPSLPTRPGAEGAVVAD